MDSFPCVVCGEPWAVAGLYGGDMLRWEADLFLLGAGCPSCEGEDPRAHEGPMDRLSRVYSVDPQIAWIQTRLLTSPEEDGSLDLAERLRRDGHNDNRPKWEPPAPVALWQCDGCDVSVVRDPEVEFADGRAAHSDDSLEWEGGKAVHYWGVPRPSAYSSFPHRVAATEKPVHVIAGKIYCPGCAAACHDCGDSIFARSDLEGGDSYAEGASFCPTGYYSRSVCLSCLEEHYTEGEE